MISSPIVLYLFAVGFRVQTHTWFAFLFNGIADESYRAILSPSPHHCQGVKIVTINPLMDWVDFLSCKLIAEA